MIVCLIAYITASRTSSEPNNGINDRYTGYMIELLLEGAAEIEKNTNSILAKNSVVKQEINNNWRNRALNSYAVCSSNLSVGVKRQSDNIISKYKTTTNKKKRKVNRGSRGRRIK